MVTRCPFARVARFLPMRTRPQRVSASKPTWSEPWSPPRPTPTTGRSHFIRGMPRSACTRGAARCRSPVPLHSNPGPEHVFVDPDTLHLNGVIDFGDAYLSHPALDLRRWAQPADRAALVDGYAAATPISTTFADNWRAISVAMLMPDYAMRPGRRTESLDGLRALPSGNQRRLQGASRGCERRATRGRLCQSRPRAACQEGAPVRMGGASEGSLAPLACSMAVVLEPHFCRHCCQKVPNASEPPENWPILNLQGSHFKNDQPAVFVAKEFVRLNVIVEMKLGRSRQGREPQDVMCVGVAYTQDVDG
jgi:hypothetical protein